MRHLTRLLAVMAALAVPAAAAAHTDYYNVTLQGEATNTSAWYDQVLSCWQYTTIAPGQTRYVAHEDGTAVGTTPGGAGASAIGSRKWGIGEFIPWEHIHPMNAQDWDTGHATRFFQGHPPPTGNSTQLSTRRMTAADPAVFNLAHNFVKWVNHGPYHVVIRANC